MLMVYECSSVRSACTSATTSSWASATPSCAALSKSGSRVNCLAPLLLLLFKQVEARGGGGGGEGAGGLFEVFAVLAGGNSAGGTAIFIILVLFGVGVLYFICQRVKLMQEVDRRRGIRRMAQLEAAGVDVEEMRRQRRASRGHGRGGGRRKSSAFSHHNPQPYAGSGGSANYGGPMHHGGGVPPAHPGAFHGQHPEHGHPGHAPSGPPGPPGFASGPPAYGTGMQPQLPGATTSIQRTPPPGRQKNPSREELADRVLAQLQNFDGGLSIPIESLGNVLAGAGVRITRRQMDVIVGSTATGRELVGSSFPPFALLVAQTAVFTRACLSLQQECQHLPSGLMNEGDFMASLSRARVWLTVDEAQRFFSSADTDNDGFICFADVACASRQMVSLLSLGPVSDACVEFLSGMLTPQEYEGDGGGGGKIGGGGGKGKYAGPVKAKHPLTIQKRGVFEEQNSDDDY